VLLPAILLENSHDFILVVIQASLVRVSAVVADDHKVSVVVSDVGGVNVHCGLGFDVVVFNHLADCAFIG
jgi:hypothetical protein